MNVYRINEPAACWFEKLLACSTPEPCNADCCTGTAEACCCCTNRLSVALKNKIITKYITYKFIAQMITFLMFKRYLF